ncbi:MAG: esterase-like activity of phytase family protein [Pseudomonadota bacterium]
MRTAASVAVALVIAWTAAAAEPVEVTATLRGHAILPALTFAAPPDDAPPTFALSGRFAGPGNARIETPYTVEGRTWIGTGGRARRGTGLALPFVGQPIQGFSGVKHIGDGVYWAVSDNGFGSKANSPDVMLMAHRIRPDWESGSVEILETVFLSDPDKLLPFRIATEFTERRYLTGADIDIEAIQPIGDRLYFGDEFGPYILATTLDGKVTFVAETLFGVRTLVSPDHPSMTVPDRPDAAVRFDVRRSRGFEGMARSPDGATLYPMLEGPLWDRDRGAVETLANGQAFVRLLAFDIAERRWTGESWIYPLEHPGHAIGDFNMISPTRGLVIERDGNEGAPAEACAADAESELDCFARPAAFKRVYLIEIGAPGTRVAKRAYVDLMRIADPDGVARVGGGDGRFAFPFVTVESVDRVDAEHIIVGNDNNLPFSSGRQIGAADMNEWILLHVGDMLK